MMAPTTPPPAEFYPTPTGDPDATVVNLFGTDEDLHLGDDPFNPADYGFNVDESGGASTGGTGSGDRPEPTPTPVTGAGGAGPDSGTTPPDPGTGPGTAPTRPPRKLVPHPHTPDPRLEGIRGRINNTLDGIPRIGRLNEERRALRDRRMNLYQNLGGWLYAKAESQVDDHGNQKRWARMAGFAMRHPALIASSGYGLWNLIDAINESAVPGNFASADLPGTVEDLFDGKGAKKGFSHIFDGRDSSSNGSGGEIGGNGSTPTTREHVTTSSPGAVTTAENPTVPTTTPSTQPNGTSSTQFPTTTRGSSSNTTATTAGSPTSPTTQPAGDGYDGQFGDVVGENGSGGQGGDVSGPGPDSGEGANAGDMPDNQPDLSEFNDGNHVITITVEKGSGFQDSFEQIMRSVAKENNLEGLSQKQYDTLSGQVYDWLATNRPEMFEQLKSDGYIYEGGPGIGWGVNLPEGAMSVDVPIDLDKEAYDAISTILDNPNDFTEGIDGIDTAAGAEIPADATEGLELGQEIEVDGVTVEVDTDNALDANSENAIENILEKPIDPSNPDLQGLDEAQGEPTRLMYDLRMRYSDKFDALVRDGYLRYNESKGYMIPEKGWAYFGEDIIDAMKDGQRDPSSIPSWEEIQIMLQGNTIEDTAGASELIQLAALSDGGSVASQSEILAFRSTPNTITTINDVLAGGVKRHGKIYFSDDSIALLRRAWNDWLQQQKDD